MTTGTAVIGGEGRLKQDRTAGSGGDGGDGEPTQPRGGGHEGGAGRKVLMS